jgi:hypothetical protein
MDEGLARVIVDAKTSEVNWEYASHTNGQKKRGIAKANRTRRQGHRNDEAAQGLQH